MGITIEIIRPRDAHDESLAVQRVERSLDDENGYWCSDEFKLQIIRERCRRAGYK